MSAFDANTSCATVLVDEWVRAGLTDAVVAPGSRSTPLALALARDARIRVQVVLDERSAAFTALGVALASGRPAVLLCTSGTAAANFHPAVVEAHHARVPMFVCTADRPPELRGVGAPQTIDQARLFGAAVRWYCDPGPPSAEAADAMNQWRALAAAAHVRATGSPAGPVHLNLPFREPLVPTGEPVVDSTSDPTRAVAGATAQPTPHEVAALTEFVRAHDRGVVVAGWGARVASDVVHRFARAAGWPVFADAISGAREGDVVSTYEAALRVPSVVERLRPEAVLRIGAPLTSKVANAWLATVDGPTLLLDADGVWLDPDRRATTRVAADATALLERTAERLEGDASASPWRDQWMATERIARHALDGALDSESQAIEGRVARDLASALPDGSSLVVASSLPVRALEWCMAPRRGVRTFSNRGVNGIDGFVSTTLGVAAASADPVGALCGDLCFLHDTNGLLGASARAVNATFVVVDNDGGGIFSYLPQYGLDEFEVLFGTPHGVDLVAVARAHGVAAERVAEIGALPGALKDAIGAGGVRVLVVPVDRVASVERHRALWESVAIALT